MQALITIVRNPYQFSHPDFWDRETVDSPLYQLYKRVTNFLNIARTIITLRLLINIQKQPIDITAELKTLSIPFLRCAAIFVNSSNPSSWFAEKFKDLLSNEDMEEILPVDEYDKLSKVLDLPKLDHFVYFIDSNNLIEYPCFF